MKTSDVFELNENEMISVQQENCGYSITGPATIIVVKETDMDKLKLQQRTIGGAAETTAPMTKHEFQKFLKDYVSLSIPVDHDDTV